MKLWYLFWNNYEKAWYAHGKLVKPVYEKEVVKWKTSTSTFIKNQMEALLEAEREKTDKQISVIQDNIKINEWILSGINKKKMDEVKLIRDEYSIRCDSLKSEKQHVEKAFSLYSLNVSKKIEESDSMLKKLLEVIWNYAQQTSEYVEGQINNLKKVFESILQWSKSFVVDEVDKNIKNETDGEKLEVKPLGKNLLYIILLVLLSLFDVVLWYSSNVRLGMKTWIALLIALLLVWIWMILIYFSAKEMKTWKWNNQISILCIVLVVVIFSAYAMQSLWTVDAIKSLFIKGDFSILLWKQDFLLRVLIIPSLFVWDILIKSVDWDFVTSRISGKTKIWRLVNRAIARLKKQSISKYVRKEQKDYEKMLNNMKELSIPIFWIIEREVWEVQSMLMPIYDEINLKRSECDTKIKEIDIKIAKLAEDELIDISKIDKKYANQISKYESLINKGVHEIHLLKEQLWNAEVSVRKWIGLWLID